MGHLARDRAGHVVSPYRVHLVSPLRVERHGRDCDAYRRAVLGALLRGLIDYLLVRTGRWVLAAWEIRSNLVVEALVGILSWIAFGFSALVIAVGVMDLLRFVTR